MSNCCRRSLIMGNVKSRANETLSRWVCQGIPLIIGIGIVAAFLLRISFGWPIAKMVPQAVTLLAIQVVFYVSMYAVRKRYMQTRDLRPTFILIGIYALFITLAGMFYAGQLGIVSATTFENNYLGFSAFVGVMICIGVGFLSFLKPKLTL